VSSKFPRFEYKAEIPNEDGTVENVVLSFKNMALIPNGVARKYRDTSDENRMWVQFEWGLSEEQLELFDRIPQPQLPSIIAAWREAEGVDLGESSASPASSTDTVGHSKPTSSATDSD
jgi:hypothetical protein